MTADGELVTASADENSELFWGMRGAGGNFGVVTEFEFQLNPVGPQVLAGPVIWPMEQSAEVLRFYRDWITEVPDELTTVVVHRKAPPLPTLPPELHGRPIVTVVCCYAGPLEDGERVLRPLKAFGSPLLDLCTRKPFVEHQAMFDASFPQGWWYYFRSCDVATLTDEVIDIAAEHAQRIRQPLARRFRSSSSAARSLESARRTRRTTTAPPATPSTSTPPPRPATGSTRNSRGRAGSGRRSRRTTPASTSTSSWTRARSGFAKRTATRSSSGCRR